MKFYHYGDIIDYGDNIQTGIALGLAIKDNEVKPDEYKELCKYAKSKGFEFRYIEFAK